MRNSRLVASFICCVLLLLQGSSSYAWDNQGRGSGNAQVVSMFVNADGSCQAPSEEITLCESTGPGSYRIEFERSAFDETPVLVVMPLGGVTVSSINQNACSKTNPCNEPRSGWFAIYTFSGGTNAVHNFIAATGY